MPVTSSLVTPIGLQSAELLQVFQRKQIKSLTGDHGPNN